MADTAVIIAETGELQEGSKLDTFCSHNGSCSLAVVNASVDGNATATLIGDTFNELQSADLKNHFDFERIMKSCMTEWRRGFGGRKPPGTQLIVAVRVWGGGGAKLYLCEPPNTVREIDNYTSTGTGASVADPLHNLLFGHHGGEWEDVQIALRRMAYLTYRAKDGNAYCGKNTQCAIVAADSKGYPIEVSTTDMKLAESAMQELDVLLSETAICAIESTDTSIDEKAHGLMEALRHMKSIRSLVFHNSLGDEIKL